MLYDPFISCCLWKKVLSVGLKDSQTKKYQTLASIKLLTVKHKRLTEHHITKYDDSLYVMFTAFICGHKI